MDTNQPHSSLGNDSGVGKTSNGLNRRTFLMLSGATAAGAVLPWAWPRTAASAAEAVLGSDYFSAHGFNLPLPRPRRVKVAGSLLSVNTVQFEHQVLEGYPATRLWGYEVHGNAASWPAATIVAEQGDPFKVRFANLLPRGDGSTIADSHLLPVDETVHTAMLDEQLGKGDLPIVTHLHGGHTRADSDGDPEGWFTQGNTQTGPQWNKVYTYDNDQESGTLWYHDHVMGLTRLNVYAGLAGMYLVRDDRERDLVAKGVLPDEGHEVELMIQDRSFDSDGQLFLPTADNVVNGILATIFGDFMCVNGAPWPHLDVEPRPYRFRMLNASDGRVLLLQLRNSAGGSVPKLIRVGTELGLSRQPVALDRLPMGPAERYDVVIDFSQYAGQRVVLEDLGVNGVLRGFKNAAGVVTNRPSDIPFTFGPPGPPLPPPQKDVMEFRVANAVIPNRKVPVSLTSAKLLTKTLRPALPNQAASATKVRKVVLLTGDDVVTGRNGEQISRTMELLGTLEKGGGTYLFSDPVTENPKLGATEIWEIYNYTVPGVAGADGLAHPMHLHLVHFQVLGRQAFSVDGGAASLQLKTHDPDHAVSATGRYLDPDLVHLVGDQRPPEEYERGWKDTVMTYGGEVTRVVCKFDRPGRYVWHCHILHHEDHDMMRPYFVGKM